MWAKRYDAMGVVSALSETSVVDASFGGKWVMAR
jgi:hypothetical protein